MISWIFSNAEGWQSTESIVAGRLFFIWIGVKKTSRAPAWKRRSWTAPSISGERSSILVWSSTIRSVDFVSSK